MEFLKHSIFINLEHRKDRLLHIVEQMKQLGITAKRFNAVKTTNGAIGCTISHIKSLEIAINENYEHIFICEDDILFTNIEVLKDSISKFANSGIEWDVLFISGNNGINYEKTNDFCVRVRDCRCGTGYVVNKHYMKTLLENMKEGLNYLMREPANKPMYALDMYWNKLQMKDRWYLLTPLTVIQAACYSDIEERNVDYAAVMLDLEKKWLKR